MNKSIVPRPDCKVCVIDEGIDLDYKEEYGKPIIITITKKFRIGK